MEPKKNHESSYFSTHSDATSLTLDDAVETLSNLAELSMDDSTEEVNSPSMQLLTDNTSDRSIQIIKNSFRVVLQYLKGFYHERTNYMLSEDELFNTRSIMLLVGEAAKKVDRQLQRLYGTHAESVTSWGEYRKLQEFYQHRISQRIDENMLGKWILQLGAFEGQEAQEKKTRAKKRRFIDLESVKNDTQYELFFMRQEDGTRYYNPRLLRAIRLVCDFGDYFGATHPNDQLKYVSQWRDHFYQQAALRTIHSAKNAITSYLREAAKFKDKELVHHMNQALLALFLAGSSEHRKREVLEDDAPNKQCIDYFLDFQSFFRSAIHSYDYQKMLTYPPKNSQRASVAMLRIVQRLAYALYFDPTNYHSLSVVLSAIVHPQEETHGHYEGDWWKELPEEYARLNKELKTHPNLPLEQLLNGLESGPYEQFDPWMQHNLPGSWFTLAMGEERIHHLRLACPTHQTYIQKAAINEEYREALHACIAAESTTQQKGHLLFDLQDRTSWSEHSRCKALEDLSQKSPFNKALTVVGFATNTDFYHQKEHYAHMHDAKTFFEQFTTELQSEASGFYFPQDLQKLLFSTFLPQLLQTVHQLFFAGRNTMRREMRLACIDIVYLFLMLRLVDALTPEAFSFVCKDGVDIGSSWSARLFMLLKVLHQDKEHSSDLDSLRLLLYGCPFLMRERLMLPEHFQRTVGLIQAVTEARQEHGSTKLCNELNTALSHFYKRPIWQAEIM